MPCSELSVGNHSAKVCTNWKTDFGQYCMVFCDNSFTLTNENEFDQWYVCGASGKWSPSAELPNCKRKYEGSRYISKYKLSILHPPRQLYTSTLVKLSDIQNTNKP